MARVGTSGKDDLCRANPGTGKTTTILNLVQHTQESTLVFTFNRKLADDNTRYAEFLQFSDWVDINTFHGFCGHYLTDREIPDDFAMLEVLLEHQLMVDGLPAEDIPLIPEDIELPTINIFVIDEAQDMTVMYYTFLFWVMQSMKARNPTMRVIVLGDERQGENTYRGADARFLTEAALLFQLDVEQLTITRSHRLTGNMARFLEEGLRLSPGIPIVSASPVGDGPPVSIFMDAQKQSDQHIFDTLFRWYEEHGKCWSRIAIIAPSLRDGRLKRRVQMLLLKGIPIWCAASVNDPVPANHVVFFTCWSIKGCTMKNVIVLGLDCSSISKYSLASQLLCPAPHFVAFTRACLEMVIVYNIGAAKQDDYQDCLPPYFRIEEYYQALAEDRTPAFSLLTTNANLALQYLERSAEFAQSVRQRIANGERYLPTKRTSTCRYSVSALCAYVDSDFVCQYLYDVKKRVFRQVASVSETAPDWTIITQTDKGDECDVSDLIGQAIPMYLIQRIRARVSARTDAISAAADRPDEAVEMVVDEEEEWLRKTNGWRMLVLERGDILNRLALLQAPTGQPVLRKRLEEARKRSFQSVRDFLLAVSLLAALEQHLYSKCLAFSHFDWVSYDMQRQAEQVIDGCTKHVTTLRTERLLQRTATLEDGRSFLVYGMIDVQTNAEVFEWKCTQSLRLEHFLQTLMYYWLSEVYEDLQSLPVTLLNIATGECWTIDRTPAIQAHVNMLVLELLRCKELSDDERLARHDALFERYRQCPPKMKTIPSTSRPTRPS